MNSRTYYAHRISTPLGDAFTVVNSNGAVTELMFEGGRNAPRDEDDLSTRYEKNNRTLVWSPDKLREIEQALISYFANDPDAFANVVVAPEGTRFQKLVWTQLQHIKHGQTETYGGIAKRIGRPKSCRAVGAANGANPVSVIIPCHRLVSSRGDLVAYGGGLPRKKALLKLEAATM